MQLVLIVLMAVMVGASGYVVARAIRLGRQSTARSLSAVSRYGYDAPAPVVFESPKAQNLTLEKSLASDHAKNHISSVSPLGLVEMTRKRTRESLEHQLCDECPTCAGRGSVKSPQTVCYEVFREVVREARQFEAQAMLVLAAPSVVEMMLDEESTGLAELEAHVGRPIRLQAETGYPVEQFDVVPL